MSAKQRFMSPYVTTVALGFRSVQCRYDKILFLLNLLFATVAEIGIAMIDQDSTQSAKTSFWKNWQVWFATNAAIVILVIHVQGFEILLKLNFGLHLELQSHFHLCKFCELCYATSMLNLLKRVHFVGGTISLLLLQIIPLNHQISLVSKRPKCKCKTKVGWIDLILWAFLSHIVWHLQSLLWLKVWI